MAIVYSEVPIKKPLLGVGDPEPKLEEGEIFIYRTQGGEYIVVEPALTPVSNAFIKRNKINYRIKINSGPFTYAPRKTEYRSRDHRKKFRIDVFVKLEVEDAVKLYHSSTTDIQAHLNKVLPKKIEKITGSYELYEVGQLADKLRDFDAYEGLIDDLRSMGLRVIDYDISVEKDKLEEQFDSGDRKTDFDLGQQLKIKKGQAVIDAEVEVVQGMSKLKANLKKIKEYDALLEEHSPETILRLASPEDQELLRDEWEKRGILQLEAPSQDRRKKVEALLSDDELN